MGQANSTNASDSIERFSRNLRTGKSRVSGSASASASTSSLVSETDRIIASRLFSPADGHRMTSKAFGISKNRKHSTTSSFETKIEAKHPILFIDARSDSALPISQPARDMYQAKAQPSPVVSLKASDRYPGKSVQGLRIQVAPGQELQDDSAGAKWRHRLPKRSPSNETKSIVAARSKASDNANRKSNSSEKSSTAKPLPAHKLLAPPPLLASPFLLAPPRPPRPMRSPQSHWSVSSVGEPTPPPSLPGSTSNWRNSGAFSAATSKTSLNRLSQHGSRSPTASQHTVPQLSATSIGDKIAQGLKIRREKVLNTRKRGPIVIVSSQRMGADRHSALVQRNSGMNFVEKRPKSISGSRAASISSFRMGSPSLTRRPPSVLKLPVLEPEPEWFDIVEDYAQDSPIQTPGTPQSIRPSPVFITPSPRPDSITGEKKFNRCVSPEPLASRLPAGHPANRFHNRFSMNLEDVILENTDSTLPAARSSSTTRSSPTLRSSQTMNSATIHSWRLSGTHRSKRSSTGTEASFYDSLDRLMEDAIKLSEETEAVEMEVTTAPVRPSLEVVSENMLGRSSSSGGDTSNKSGETVPLCLPPPVPPKSAKYRRTGSIGSLGRRASNTSALSFPSSISQATMSPPQTPLEKSVPRRSSAESDIHSAFKSYQIRRASSMSLANSEGSLINTATFDAFPMPPPMPAFPKSLSDDSFARQSAPRPLSHNSMPSTASTPSTSSFDSSVKTLPPTQIGSSGTSPRRKDDEYLEKSVKELDILVNGGDSMPSSPSVVSIDGLSVSTVNWFTAGTWVLESNMRATAEPQAIETETLAEMPTTPLIVIDGPKEYPTPTFGNFSLQDNGLRPQKVLSVSPAGVSPMTTTSRRRSDESHGSVESTPENQRQGFLPFLAVDAAPELDGVDTVTFPAIVSQIYASNHVFEAGDELESLRRRSKPIECESTSTTWDSFGRIQHMHKEMTKKGDLERSKMSDHRLGSLNKRGFNKGEIRGWLSEQA